MDDEEIQEEYLQLKYVSTLVFENLHYTLERKKKNLFILILFKFFGAVNNVNMA